MVENFQSQIKEKWKTSNYLCFILLPPTKPTILLTGKMAAFIFPGMFYPRLAIFPQSYLLKFYTQVNPITSRLNFLSLTILIIDYTCKNTLHWKSKNCVLIHSEKLHPLKKNNCASVSVKYKNTYSGKGQTLATVKQSVIARVGGGKK